MNADTIAEQIDAESPDEWTMSTVTDQHIAAVHTSGRSIGLNNHTVGWTVMGVANYGDEDYPRFARAASGDVAVSSAVKAMAAVVDGDPADVEIVGRASDLNEGGESSDSDGGEPDSTRGDETNDTEKVEGNPTDDTAGEDAQPSLKDFL